MTSIFALYSTIYIWRERARTHFAPEPKITAGTVRSKILKSSAERPVIDVIEIEFYPIAKIAHLIASADLPETS